MSKHPITSLAKPQPNSKKSSLAKQFAEAADKAETTRLNANIRVDLHRKLKARAALEGRTIGELIEEWIEGLK